jgi:hypothetical protein
LKAKLRQTFTCKLKLSDALTDVNQQNENLKKENMELKQISKN